MKRTTKIILPILILVAGFVAMFGLLSLKEDNPKRPPEVRAKVVETVVVNLESVETEVIAYGRAISAQPVQLYAEVSGTLVEGDVPFKPAQSFSRGDLLLKIDDRQAKLDLSSAKSSLMTALANVIPEIKADFPDENQVWQDYFNAFQLDKKLDPLPETNNARIKLFLSRFNVYNLYFSVQSLAILVDKHYFYAPFDGSIVSADLRVGSIARNGTFLGEIINLEEMEVVVPVEAENLQWIDRQRPVTFKSSEVSGKWTGRISRIGSNIVYRTQAVDVYISVDNGRAASLLNGVFLEAHIPGKSVQLAFAVPPKAVYEDKYVYLIADGVLVRREVEIVRREIDRVIVNGGLENGDILIVEIMQGVAPGMPAQPKVISTESRGQ